MGEEIGIVVRDIQLCSERLDVFNVTRTFVYRRTFRPVVGEPLLILLDEILHYPGTYAYGEEPEVCKQGQVAKHAVPLPCDVHIATIERKPVGINPKNSNHEIKQPSTVHTIAPINIKRLSPRSATLSTNQYETSCMN